MSRFGLVQRLVVVGLFSLVVPGQSFAKDTTLVAKASTSEVTAAPARQVRQLPPDVQQDPAARVMRLQQIRRPIVQKIKALSEQRYRQVVRPALGRQLQQMGFDDQDVAYFLTDLDRTRGGK
jgi:hypothetical protein